jgi:TetR/AcrR family transcriptional repressor of nem operon
VTTSGEATAAKILDAGRQLIARRGYSNFSYADVSAAVTIHKASIHHHFPAKPELALAVTHHSRAIFTADTAALAAGGATPLAQLQAYLAERERCLIDDHEMFCVAAMLGAEVPFLREDVAEAVGEYFASIASWLENLLAAGAACGEFRLGGPVQGEAATLVSLIYGALLVARATRNPSHFRQVSSVAVARLTGT